MLHRRVKADLFILGLSEGLKSDERETPDDFKLLPEGPQPAMEERRPLRHLALISKSVFQVITFVMTHLYRSNTTSGAVQLEQDLETCNRDRTW